MNYIYHALASHGYAYVGPCVGPCVCGTAEDPSNVRRSTVISALRLSAVQHRHPVFDDMLRLGEELGKFVGKAN